MSNRHLNDLSLNNALSSNASNYSYTFLDSPFTDDNGELYPASNNPDWGNLLNWMNKTGDYSKPPSVDESLSESDIIILLSDNPYASKVQKYFSFAL